MIDGCNLFINYEIIPGEGLTPVKPWKNETATVLAFKLFSELRSDLARRADDGVR